MALRRKSKSEAKANLESFIDGAPEEAVKPAEPAPEEVEVAAAPKKVKEKLERTTTTFAANRRLWKDFKYYCEVELTSNASEQIEKYMLEIMNKSKNEYI